MSNKKKRMGEFNKQLEGKIAFDGSRLSLDNAIDHFEAAEILAGKEKFGLAISHTILAAEECAKSMILFVKYNIPDIYKMDIPDGIKEGVPVIDKYDLKKIFSKHGPKQSLAYFASFMGIILTKISPLPLQTLETLLLSDKDLTGEEVQSLKQIRDERLNEAKKWLKSEYKTESELHKNTKWWKGVNKRKNDGLYVGLENWKWKSPKDFTEKDYKIAYDFISGMIGFMDKNLEIQASIDSYNERLNN